MVTPDDSGVPASKPEIEADIEEARAELGQTVDALATKLNVKGRAQEAAAATKDNVIESAKHSEDYVVSASRTAAVHAREHKVPVAAVLVAALALVGVVWWRRRR